jgi:hypothetical protein
MAPPANRLTRSRSTLTRFACQMRQSERSSDIFAAGRRVPLLVWSNFDLPRDEGEWSTNALPAYLLEKMGIAPTELFAVNAHTRRRLPVLGRYCRGAEGKAWRLEDLPADAQGVVEAYRLLQYDLLFGKQYSLCCNGRVDRTDR